MATQPGVSWPARMARRSVVMRADLHRLWRHEGPIGTVTTSVGSAVGLGNFGKEVVSADEGQPHHSSSAAGGSDTNPTSESATGERLSPHQRDELRAGVGKGYRMSLVPKRNIGYSLWIVGWNALQAIGLTGRALCAFTGAELYHRGPVGLPIGLAKGASAAAQYAFLGLIASPALLLTSGVVNTTGGLWNAYKGERYFDTERGHYVRGHSLNTRRAYGVLPDRVIAQLAAPYEADYRVHKRAQAEFAKSPAGRAMKSAVEMIRRKPKPPPEEKVRKESAARALGMEDRDRPDAHDPYDVLQVPAHATQADIKQSYGRLAKVFHPDKNPEPTARAKFDELTAAYKILSDPKAREAYDLAGHKAGEAALARNAARGGSSGGRGDGSGKGGGPSPRAFGGLATVKDGRLLGTPGEVNQSMFGGAPFGELVAGPALRSPWHADMLYHCRLSFQDFERLQVSRMVRQSAVLAAMLDAYALEDSPLMALRHAAALKLGGDDVPALLTAIDQREEAPTGVNRLRSAGSSSAASAASSAQSSPRGGGGGRAGVVDSSSPAATSAAAATAAAKEGRTSASTTTAPRTSPEYAARCDKFAARLAKCCFGQELLYEVGQTYVLASKRYTGAIPFYKPKQVSWTMTWSGLTRFLGAVRGEVSEQGLGQDTQYNLFAMEFDNVIVDVVQVSRWMCMVVQGDAAVPAIVRDDLRRQCGLAKAASTDKDSSASPSPATKAPSVRPIGVRGGGSSAAARSGAPIATSGTVQVSDGFFVSYPTTLSRGNAAQHQQVRDAVARLLSELNEADAKRWLAAVADEVRTRRLDALAALGQAYITRGKKFGFRTMDECTTHMRLAVACHENTTVPPMF
jgi:hypothetical protein